MTVIGLMSGTSLDGVDLVLVNLSVTRKKVKYSIIKAKTIAYPKKLRDRLKKARKINGLELTILDRELGRYYAEIIKEFIKKDKVELISSHGHTIFHQPEKQITLQIGSGAEIAALTGIKTACDFRTTDVALNGQGAPLVPFGDELLFSKYDYCLNLGGYANISFRKKSKRMAFDICPCNIILNHLANTLGKVYDDGGKISAKGKIDRQLLTHLNNIRFYKENKNKSLGNEWLEKNIIPVLNKSKIKTEDKLATLTEHITFQIARHITKNKSVLVTGGGAFNKFLIERLKKNTKAKIIVPNDELVNFKEALIFALLGFLREKEWINTFASATGAKRNSSGGAIYHP